MASLAIARFGFVSSFALASCVRVCAGEISAPFSAAAYESSAKDKAVVLVSANWNRRWRCGAYENAQLRSLAFDRNASERTSSDGSDLVIEDGVLPAKKGFTDYAFIVEPGEYQLSGFDVKVAKSVSDVGHLTADRTALIADGNAKGGSFWARAGETVYIGHFFLDCAQEPIPWRFYPEDEGDFAKYLKLIAREFPGIPTEGVKFRLFKTTTMGNPHASSDR
jgi:hypothetical protein